MGGYTDSNSPSVAEDLTALNAGLDEAFDSLADTDNLVVDVRLNGGGYDLAWTEPYTATVEPSTRPSHPQGKIVLLTSALTASAAETFTNASRILEGAPTKASAFRSTRRSRSS
jgi:C-terminal processing protease CtpA/Prc